MSRVTFAALFIAAAVILTGCQGGPGPSASPSGPGTTPAPTLSVSVPAASATPTSTGVYKPADSKGKAENVPVPVMPELAKENSKAGLEAFIGYWYAQQNYAMETGDQTEWSKLSSPGCSTCKRIEKGINDSYINGRWSVGGNISLPAIEPIWVMDANVQQSKVQVVQKQIEYFNPDGTVGRPSEPASNSAFALLATHKTAGWMVVDLGVID
jgi:hypothetical protein